MILIPEYWRAVARGIDAEDEKASIFIRHRPSLGIARETILRTLVANHTPEPFDVHTGFINYLLQNVESRKLTAHWHSKQCDLLVYDPRVDRPYYAIDQLVVVPRNAVKSVIEVKSELKLDTFQEILMIWRETGWVPAPTFGFAFEGVKFSTFLKYLRTSIRTSLAGVPECLVVHCKNYIFVRSSYRLAPISPKRHRPAKYQLAVDFGSAENELGSATAMFLELYRRSLAEPFDSAESYLLNWFNGLALSDNAKVSIDDRGGLRTGPIHE